MISSFGRSIFLAGTSLIAALAAPPRPRRTMRPPPRRRTPAPTDAAQEGDIVVTALRRSENLQDVPAAITAFTADTVEAAGIERPIDFVNLTSNVNLVETQNAGNAFIVIRGITQARNCEPSVAVIVDGVQQVNPAQFNQELFDIEQIEVLKGPQGAVYGRNAIGGAIVIRTRQPTDEFEGQVRAGVDNGFGYWLRGSVSGPIGDTSASASPAPGTTPTASSGTPSSTRTPIRSRISRCAAPCCGTPSADFTVDLRGSMSRLRPRRSISTSSPT